MSEIPFDFESARLSDFPSGLVNDTERGYLILGGLGSGKTHLAAAICRQHAKGETLFATAHNWLEGLRCEFDKRPCRAFPAEEDEYIEAPYCPAVYIEGKTVKGRPITARAFDADFIVIDDYGTGNSTAWAEAELLSIINDRLDNHKPLAITTNLDMKTMKKRNERLFDRMRFLDHIVLDGKSRRGKR